MPSCPRTPCNFSALPHNSTMTKQLELVLNRIRGLSAAQQNDVAALLAALTGTEREPYVLSADEHAAVTQGLKEAERGEFVSDTDMRAFWSRHKTT